MYKMLDATTVITGLQTLTLLKAVYLTLILCALYLINKSQNTKKRNYPPGPKPKPLIGNLLDLPPDAASVAEYYTAHREKYGPISHMQIGGQHIYILNSVEASHELLTRRAAKYSDRPALPFAGELVGWNDSIVLAQPGERFRNMRKQVHNQLGSNRTLEKWATTVDGETKRYLLRLLDDPKNFYQHVRDEAGSIILKIVYGYQTSASGEDKLVKLVGQVMKHFSEAFMFGVWMVDTVPWLKYLPEWFPGATFKKLGREWNQWLQAATKVPFEFSKQQIANGTAVRSMVSETFEKNGGELSAEEEDILKWTAVTMYAGGSDTTVCAMEWFFKAMIKHPEVVRKAQEEIDAVVGDDDLPQTSDRPRLPYIEAVLKETLRWEPIGELNAPHVASQDDVYEGYDIPKGSIMLGHVYGMLHDPAVYPDPFDFKPERYLGENPQMDPGDVLFGAGRRVCPGRWLATSNMWLELTRTLACFNLNVVKGQEPSDDRISGVVRRPAPFQADIQVRSEKHAELIRAAAAEYPWPETSDSDLL